MFFSLVNLSIGALAKILETQKETYLFFPTEVFKACLFQYLPFPQSLYTKRKHAGLVNSLFVAMKIIRVCVCFHDDWLSMNVILCLQLFVALPEIDCHTARNLCWPPILKPLQFLKWFLKLTNEIINILYKMNC